MHFTQIRIQIKIIISPLCFNFELELPHLQINECKKLINAKPLNAAQIVCIYWIFGV
jgi:hypothetical protein